MKTGPGTFKKKNEARGLGTELNFPRNWVFWSEHFSTEFRETTTKQVTSEPSRTRNWMVAIGKRYFGRELLP